MATIIQNLKKLKKIHRSWTKVAKELGISYRYVVLLRQGQKPGRFLNEAIERKMENLDD
jgi:hypothetical protein